MIKDAEKKETNISITDAMTVATLLYRSNKGDENIKSYESKKYNFVFDKKTGFFVRWGENLADDPEFAPFPEILDLEVTTVCHGINGKVCPFCYKANTPNGNNMSFETFKKIFDKFDKSLTQIAFGADSHATSNPDLFKMMKYARENGVIPNITVAQISDKTADELANVCGAVAVSRYDDKNICYDSVKKLIDRGMTQINIHQLISEETFDNAMETINDSLTDPRLKKLNAIVFLSLKQKGRGTSFTPLSQDKFKILVDTAMKKNVSFGFDSCSCFKFLKSIRDHKDFKRLEMMGDPCESSLFSSYIDVEGKFYPCSFSADAEGWEEGIDVVNCTSFTEDIWNHPRVVEFRNKLIGTKCGNDLNCRECPLYDI